MKVYNYERLSMKNILINVALCLGLVACGRNSIEHPVNVVPPVAPVVTPPVVPTSQTIKGDVWEMIIPATWEKIDVETNDSEIVCYGNEQDKVLMCLERHPFSENLDIFVQAAAQSVAETGGHVVAAQAVLINDVKFFILTIKKDDANLRSWLTLENGAAYALSCGGVISESQETCNRIANSLKFTK